MDMGFAVISPLAPVLSSLKSAFCTSGRGSNRHFFQADPRGSLHPCASIALHLHQVARGTCTPRWSNMLGTLKVSRAYARDGPAKAGGPNARRAIADYDLPRAARVSG